MLKEHLQLHFIVLLFGFTAILGKLISLPATELVGYRMTLAAIGMVTVNSILGLGWKAPRKAIAQMVGVGALVALHWITFFAAIKVSNVAVTLGCFASVTLFTALLEPLVEKRRIYLPELLIGVVIILGLYIMSRFALIYIQGIVLALISAFLAALFGVLNKQLTGKYHFVLISMYEMTSGAIIVLLYLLLAENGFTYSPLSLPTADWVWLLLLAWVCTTYAFVGIMYLLRHLSAYTVALAINLEPVYGILFAYLLFGESERMHTGFYAGALVIIAAIIVYPVLKRSEKVKREKF